MKRLALLVPALLVTTACPPTEVIEGGQDSGAQAPLVSSISPTSGPVAGGTDVAVFGANFEDGVKLFIGETEASSVVRVTKSRLTAKTPPGAAAGAVTVKVVNPDGQEAALANGFMYEAPPVKTISNAYLENPAQTDVTSTNATVQVAVNGVVNVAGVTDAAGAGVGIIAQVGHGAPDADPANQSAFTWIDAAYVADVPSVTFENDRYSGNVTLNAPTGSAPATYSLAARFSVDNGTTWVLADRDGSSNGVTNGQLAKVSVGKPKLNWCKLGGVVTQTEVTNLRTNQTSATLYAQLYHQGVTEASGAGTGITAQLGYGPANALIDASGNVNESAFSWINATFNVDQGNNDEWKATLPTPAVGTYKYAYRVSLNNGPYLYCDADGPDNGFTEAQLGTLNVTAVQIDSCRLQFPGSVVAPSGSQTAEIFGRVTAQGVTDATGAPANLVAEIGYGAATATDPSTWSWSAATFNIDVDGTTDEYRARITAPAAGSYRYAYRFRYGTTGAYTYCDLDGSTTNGFTIAEAGRLNVPIFTNCKLVAQTATTIASGASVSLEARVYGAGVTTSAGANANIRAQIGVGPSGTSAQSSTLWGWANASYASDISTGGDTGWDRYVAAVNPAYTGSRAVAARFSSDNGQSWLYCDLNSYQTGGFEEAQQQALTVNAHDVFDFCNLQFPTTVTAGQSATVYGRIYEPGVTEAPGAPATVTAQLGYGPSVEDPGVSSAWTWINASWNTQTGTSNNDDEFQATLPATVPAGSSYAYRYYTNLPATSHCYGDLDGSSSGGFSGERQDSSPNLGRVVP